MWEHNQLAEDLAIALGGTPFLDIPLGSVSLAFFKGAGVQRADVLKVQPSYKRFAVSIYEIKISRSDFLSDIRNEKWKGYLPHCHRFYFAFPEGIAQKDDVPKEAGIMIREAKTWKVIRHPKLRDVDIPQETLYSLIFSKQRHTHREVQKNFFWMNYIESIKLEDILKHNGKRIAYALQHEREFLEMHRALQYLLHDSFEHQLYHVKPENIQANDLYGVANRLDRLEAENQRLQALLKDNYDNLSPEAQDYLQKREKRKLLFNDATVLKK